MTAMPQPTIAQQLAAQGLRLACSWERGWYVIVTDATGQPVKVWATDLDTTYRP
jgi:hypothetical protein